MEGTLENTPLVPGSQRAAAARTPVRALVAASGLLALAGLAHRQLATTSEATALSTRDVFTPDAVPGTTLKVMSENEYGMVNQWLYPFLNKDGTVLVEPYKNTTLHLLDVKGTHARWKLQGDDIGETTDDHHLDFVFEATGAYDLVVEVDQGEFKLEAQVYCKYVRREVRTLSDTDRERFLDAAHTLWEVTTLEGREKLGYGDDYYDINYLTVIHNDLAGNPYCDFLHGGLNFLGGHVALGNMFEKSMQQVDPSVSLAYWDYNDDYMTFANNADDALWKLWNSTIWGADFFGSSNAQTGVIETGRWAYTQVPQVEADMLMESGLFGYRLTHSYADCHDLSDLDHGGFSGDQTTDNRRMCGANGKSTAQNHEDDAHVVNAFGLLRSPWNLNSMKYLIRSHDNCGSKVTQFPQCVSLLDVQNTYETFYDYVMTLMYSPHGSVHNFVGGAFGRCHDSFEVLTEFLGEDLASEIQYKNNDILKWFYQLAMNVGTGLSWPDSNSCVGKDQSECTMTCSSFNRTYYHIEELIESWTRTSTNDDSETASYLSMLRASSHEGKEALVHALCNSSIFVGDMLNSGSSLDPAFWMTHPSVERIWQRKALSGTLKNMTWPTSDVTCTGHHPDYKMRWNTYTFEDGTGSANLTNTQYRDMLDPASPAYHASMPYVYDHFNWTACATAFVNMGVPNDMMYDSPFLADYNRHLYPFEAHMLPKRRAV